MRVIPTIKSQTGFTLLEAMVALLIFSVGLLGLAGMQMSGMQNSQSAILYTLAVQQSYDMAERIRANLAGATLGDYDDLKSATVSCAATPGSCTSTAHLDFANWYNLTKDVLPGGSGTVTGEAVDNNGDGTNDSLAFTITVSWTEPQILTPSSIELVIQP